LIDPSLIQRVITAAITIQQIPAPTFQEGKRSTYLLQQFKSEALRDVSQDKLGNVYGRIPGSNSNHPIVVTAHLDTVFPLETNLQIVQSPERVAGAGIGDNSLGLAGLLGLVWLLKGVNKLRNDIWLVANVGEEGLGNLVGMKAVVERFGKVPKAYLILEGMALGSIYHRGLSVRRYRVQARTQGGHSWVNFGRPSAIHEMAHFIARLERMEYPLSPKSSFNVGTIYGGTSINTIAAQAEIEVDLRSENGNTLQSLSNQLEQMVLESNRDGEQPVEFECQIIGDRPAGVLPVDHELVRLAKSALERQEIIPHTEIGSTDANVPLSMGYPAVCIGITNGSNAHTKDEFIETRLIPKGLSQLINLVLDVDRTL